MRSSPDHSNTPSQKPPFQVFESTRSGRLLVEDTAKGFDSRVKAPRPEEGETVRIEISGEIVSLIGARDNAVKILSSKGESTFTFSNKRIPLDD